MKIIDLLNKIANGEEVPIKIKYKNVILSYRIDIKDYAGDNYFLSDLIGDENIGLILNDEVEIIEEDKKIEKISNGYYHEKQDRINEIFQRKINEIIDKLNEVSK